MARNGPPCGLGSDTDTSCSAVKYWRYVRRAVVSSLAGPRVIRGSAHDDKLGPRRRTKHRQGRDAHGHLMRAVWPGKRCTGAGDGLHCFTTTTTGAEEAALSGEVAAASSSSAGCPGASRVHVNVTLRPRTNVVSDARVHEGGKRGSTKAAAAVASPSVLPPAVESKSIPKSPSVTAQITPPQCSK